MKSDEDRKHSGARGAEKVHRVPARRSARAWGFLGAIVAIALAVDLATKYVAFHTIADRPVRFDREQVLSTDRLELLIPSHDPVVVVPNVLEFTLVLNPGAVFGAGAGLRWFFITFTVAALAFAAWLFGWWTSTRDRAAHVAIGLLVAGGVGNLYDRVIYACVRDFIHPLPGVPLPFGLTWPGGGRELWPYVSNVADLWLLIGIAMLMIESWRRPAPAPDPRKDDGRGAESATDAGQGTPDE